LEGVVRVAIEGISRPANKNTLQTLLQSTAFPQPAGRKVCMRVSLQPALSANTTVGTKDRSTAFQASTKSFRERQQKKKTERDSEKKTENRRNRKRKRKPTKNKKRKIQKEKEKKTKKNKKENVKQKQDDGD